MIACLRNLALLLLLLPGVAAAQMPADVDRAGRAAIRAAISSQIDAFRHDDAAAAFGFAAPSIQGMFGSPDIFLEMVRRGYQPVYRPSDVAFGALVMIDGQPTQLVRVIGPDGRPVLALYHMEQQADGSWRIAGCVLTRDADVST